MLGHKLSLNRFNKTDIIQSIFYDRVFLFSFNNEVRKQNRTKTGKWTNLYKLDNTLLNNKCINEEITREIRKYLRDEYIENYVSAVSSDSLRPYGL